jgi:hypothetical protein
LTDKELLNDILGICSFLASDAHSLYQSLGQGANDADDDVYSWKRAFISAYPQVVGPQNFAGAMLSCCIHSYLHDGKSWRKKAYGKIVKLHDSYTAAIDRFKDDDDPDDIAATEHASSHYLLVLAILEG